MKSKIVEISLCENDCTTSLLKERRNRCSGSAPITRRQPLIKNLIKKIIKKITSKQDPFKEHLFALKRLHPDLVIKQTEDKGVWSVTITGPSCSLTLATDQKPSFMTIYQLSRAACYGGAA